MKFGRIKRQHGRVSGLDAILDRIVADCPFVSRIVPGRIKVRRGKGASGFKIQYPTGAGLKCIYTTTGAVQEVFIICSDAEKTAAWLLAQGTVGKQAGNCTNLRIVEPVRVDYCLGRRRIFYAIFLGPAGSGYFDGAVDRLHCRRPRRRPLGPSTGRLA
jgi:hypothetical protein